jgi:hypothetical protein
MGFPGVRRSQSWCKSFRASGTLGPVPLSNRFQLACSVDAFTRKEIFCRPLGSRLSPMLNSARCQRYAPRSLRPCGLNIASALFKYSSNRPCSERCKAPSRSTLPFSVPGASAPQKSSLDLPPEVAVTFRAFDQRSPTAVPQNQFSLQLLLRNLLQAKAGSMRLGGREVFQNRS